MPLMTQRHTEFPFLPQDAIWGRFSASGHFCALQPHGCHIPTTTGGHPMPPLLDAVNVQHRRGPDEGNNYRKVAAFLLLNLLWKEQLGVLQKLM